MTYAAPLVLHQHLSLQTVPRNTQRMLYRSMIRIRCVNE